MKKYILGVQISGNFAPGYPELFFERVPGTRIFVIFPKITLKKSESATRKRHMLTYQYELIGFTMQRIRTVPN